MLDTMEPKTAPTTANGQRRIARPAKGTHIVSKKGPSRPMRSWNNRCHPLKSMYGLLQMAMSETSGKSKTIPREQAIIAPGRGSNLQNFNIKLNAKQNPSLARIKQIFDWLLYYMKFIVYYARQTVFIIRYLFFSFISINLPKKKETREENKRTWEIMWFSHINHVHQVSDAQPAQKAVDNKYVLSHTLFPTCFSPAYSTWFFQNLHFSGTRKIWQNKWNWSFLTSQLIQVA